MADQLDELRQQLDALDTKLVSLLDQRFLITDQVAAYKNSHGIALTDTGRELAIIDRLQQLAKHPALSTLLPDLYNSIIGCNKQYRAFMRHTGFPFRSVGIIGLGLIGGSIAKALHTKSPGIRIHTLSRPGSTRKPVDYITEHETMESLTRTCECIFICTPIEEIIPTASNIQLSYKGTKPLLVMDVASVKEPIAAAFEKMTTETIRFVATHPMAGSEASGFEASKMMLFVHMPWIITAHGKNTEHDIEPILQIVTYMGSTVVRTDATEHDRRVASVSHLIFLLSTYVYAFIHDTHREALQLAGSGFLSVTRLASASAVMHDQIARNNTTNIAEALKGFMEYVRTHPINLRDSLTFFNMYKQNRDALLKKRTT